MSSGCVVLDRIILNIFDLFVWRKVQKVLKNWQVEADNIAVAWLQVLRISILLSSASPQSSYIGMLTLKMLLNKIQSVPRICRMCISGRPWIAPNSRPGFLGSCSGTGDGRFFDTGPPLSFWCQLLLFCQSWSSLHFKIIFMPEFLQLQLSLFYPDMPGVSLK
jgi:hypothetical protein